MEPVKQIDLKENMKVSELIKEMSLSGVFGAGKLAKCADIFELMLKDKATIFLGAAGALVPAGMKNILIDLLGYVNVFVATGANLTHDLIEAIGHKHFQGNEHADDKKLNEKGIDRIYDVYMENKVYQDLEDFFDKHFDELKDITNIKEFLWKIGGFLDKKSILKTCYEKKIPIFCPGIADSGIGLMMNNKIMEGKEVKLKALEDLNEIIKISMDSKKKGVIYLGGGVPKNYIQQAMQFTSGADYGIQITLDRANTGGSSGAELKEGISWGKLNKDAKFVNLHCDVTIALPIIVAGLKEKIK